MLQVINKIFSEKPTNTLDEDQLKEIKHNTISAWKNLTKNKEATLDDVITYITLRSFDNYDISKTLSPEEMAVIIENGKSHFKVAFTPITNSNKLNNGCRPYSIPFNAFYHFLYIRNAIFSSHYAKRLGYEGLIEHSNLNKFYNAMMIEFQ